MDSQTRWWFGADGKWRRGDPPRGWWQAADRRWHPPEDPPDDASQAPPRHMATTADGDPLIADDDSPDDQRLWTRLGVPVALGVLILVVAALGIVWAGSSISVHDQTGSSPSGESRQQDSATTPTTADELQLTDPFDETDASAADRPASEADGSTSDEPASTASPTPTSTAGSQPAVTTGGGPAAGATGTTTGGQSDDCPPWVPPGQPAHPIAPDRANRACN